MGSAFADSSRVMDGCLGFAGLAQKRAPRAQFVRAADRSSDGAPMGVSRAAVHLTCWYYFPQPSTTPIRACGLVV